MWICVLSFVATVAANSVSQDGEPVSVLSSTVVSKVPHLQASGAQAVLPEPEMVQPLPGRAVESVPSTIFNHQLNYQPVLAPTMTVVCCQQCTRKKCRCPKPAPIEIEFCLVDPCGCSHQACVSVPACCLGEQPEISWRDGVGSRQIATLCWRCCDHQVKVVVNGRGKVRVRD